MTQIQKPIVLRPYQQECIDAIYSALQTRDDNPCAVLPTGSGKTPILANICKDAVKKWSGRVLVLAHVKELLQQSVEKLSVICPDISIGVYSSGLKKRDTNHSVIVAGIQSVYKKACDLGAFDLIIIDEAHRISPTGDTMYRQFLDTTKKINPNVRVIGLTATPYRLKGGHICKPENILNHICYESKIPELIEQGYICPLKSKGSKQILDTTNIHIKMGEFASNEIESLMDDNERVLAVCKEIYSYAYNRKTCLIFATSIKHGYHIQKVLSKITKQEVFTVFGDTSLFDRDNIINRFKSGSIQYLVNVNVLTTGFDAPNIDCIAMVRPTMSPGLYYQMVGRGFRMSEGKNDCLILDFGGNILRHGAVDEIEISEKKKKKGDGIAPIKQCPSCQELIHASLLICPACDHEFPQPNLKHETTSSTSGILSTDYEDTEYQVKSVSYEVHIKYHAKEGDPHTMRVDYELGWKHTQSEWVCFEHQGYARNKAEQWWRSRSNASIPETSAGAVELANMGELAETQSITVRGQEGKKYNNIIKYSIGSKPKLDMPDWVTETDEEDDVPFY